MTVTGLDCFDLGDVEMPCNTFGKKVVVVCPECRNSFSSYNPRGSSAETGSLRGCGLLIWMERDVDRFRVDLANR
jgi:hypothetical protein